MSTIDLIVLGILLNSPKNAFELARFIDDRDINRLIKISKPAVYKCCKRLFKSGFLDGETVREGEMPEKVIYSVNSKGQDRFYELMAHFSNNLNSFYFEFNTVVWNLENLNPVEGLKIIQNLGARLHELSFWIHQHESEIPPDAGFSVKMIVKQYRMVILTLVQWVDEMIEEYKTLTLD